MLTASNIAQLNKALENSFAAIKKDMNELRVSINSQNEKFNSVHKEIDTARTNSVTSDKLNVLKIKLGEVNEDVKKVWDIEKQVKGMTSTVNKKSLLERLDEVQDKVVAMEIKLGQKIANIDNKAATEVQLKAVVSQVGGELQKLSNEIRKSETSIEELRRRNNNKELQKLADGINSTNKDVVEVRKLLQSYVDKDEMKNLVNDVTKDLDSMKKDVSTLYKRDSAFIREAEMKNVLKSINKEFDGVANEISSLKNKNKEFVSVSQIKGLVNDISDEFADIKAELSKIGKQDVASKKDLDALRAKFGDLQKESKKAIVQVKESPKKMQTPTYGASVVMKNTAPAKQMPVVPMRKTKAFSSFAITVSFLLLISSIVTYYTSFYVLTDSLAISAVIAFIIGMFLKLLVALKRN